MGWRIVPWQPRRRHVATLLDACALQFCPVLPFLSSLIPYIMSLGKKVTLNTGAQIPYVAVPESI